MGRRVYRMILIIMLLPVLPLAAQDTLWLSTGAIDLSQSKQILTSGNWTQDFSHQLFSQRYYGYVSGTRQHVSEDIVLQEYLPEQWFSALIYKALTPDQLAAYAINGVYFPTVKDKIDLSLTGATLPYHIYTGPGRILLHVSLFDTLYWAEYSTFFERKEYKVKAYLPQIRLVELEIPASGIEVLAKIPFVRFIQPVPYSGEPENDQARTGQRGNYLYSDHPSGLQYDGTGIKMAVNDDGDVGPHIDFKNRLDQLDVADTLLQNDHGDHVSGIIAGAGNKDPRLRGVAPGADLKIYAYTPNASSGKALYAFPNAYQNENVLITSTSYSDGCNTGYTSFAQLMDQQVSTLPSLMHVFSAGNNGNSNCGYGAGAGWGNITGGNKAAKNVLTVGNVNKSDVLQSTSSKGPVHDGRIKPELVAVGQTVESTTSYPASHGYTVKSGTSMSCPGVSGVLAQLYQAYADFNSGNLPNSALIKAVLMNTADDLGNPGPDYKHGYGRVNARRAYNTIEEGRFFSGTLNQGGQAQFVVNVPPGARELRVMLYWHDKPSAAGAAIALVNNLNMELVDGNNTTWQPWILDFTANASNLNANAIRGIDNRNNTEQVTIANPLPGNVNILINGVNIPQGPQPFYLVYEILIDELVLTYPNGGETFVPGSTEKIRWDSYGSTGTFTAQYSLNGGNTWLNIATNIPAAQRYTDWVVPNLASGNILVRVTRGSNIAVSDTVFSILGVPLNLALDTVCGSEVVIKWDAVSSATGYEVFLLGNKYMESVGTTTNTRFKLTAINTAVENWISVRALGPNDAKGRRAVAINQPPLALNCLINRNLEAGKLLFPLAEPYPSCMVSSAEPVIMKIINRGLQPMNNFQVGYSLNGGPPVVETVIATVAPGDSLVQAFVQTMNISAPGIYNLVVWTQLLNDQFQFNDTVHVVFEVIPGIVGTYPMEEDFESFANCATTPGCGSILCNLSNGFINPSNIQHDGMDWRISSGPTPSANTGPEMDYKPGTLTGKYAYLEATNCGNTFADLYLPCIDLSASTQPKLKFAYSMLGEGIGTLDVEVYRNHSWTNHFTISGPHLPEWRTEIIDLSMYQGQTILIRFRGSTTADFTADMALDDIILSDIIAGINIIGDTAFCIDSVTTVSSQSLGSISTWFWDFGQDANLQTSTLPGPHQVSYTTSGIKTISLTVTGPEGTNTATRKLYVNDPPVADFQYTMVIPQIFFTNNSQHGLVYQWDFGDGENSGLFEPEHTYDADGEYIITLWVDNGCGIDSIVDTVLVVGVGIPVVPALPKLKLSVYPNPAHDQLYVHYEVPQTLPVEVMIFDLAGKTMFREKFTTVNTGDIPIPVGSFSDGVYLLRISGDFPDQHIKFIKTGP